jgi:hypothetical protein
VLVPNSAIEKLLGGENGRLAGAPKSVLKLAKANRGGFWPAGMRPGMALFKLMINKVLYDTLTII